MSYLCYLSAINFTIGFMTSPTPRFIRETWHACICCLSVLVWWRDRLLYDINVDSSYSRCILVKYIVVSFLHMKDLYKRIGIWIVSGCSYTCASHTYRDNCRRTWTLNAKSNIDLTLIRDATDDQQCTYALGCVT